MSIDELRFLRLREVALATGIPYSTVKVDAASGFAPTVPVGRGTRRRHRRMTVEQVRRYQQAYQERAGVRPACEQEPKVQPDPMSQAVAASRQLARRARRRADH